LYQSLIVTPGFPGPAAMPPCGANTLNTSLSLNTTLVRGSLLENGYVIWQLVTVQAASMLKR